MLFSQEGDIRRPLFRCPLDHLMLASISFPFIPTAKASHFCELVDEPIFITGAEFVDLLHPSIEELLRERKSLEAPIERGESGRPPEKMVQEQTVRAIQCHARLHNFTGCHLSSLRCVSSCASTCARSSGS